jgi:hypothetical protein
MAKVSAPKKTLTPEQRRDALLASIVIDDEWRVGNQNASSRNISFEEMVDMLECKRSKKEYQWMSDIFIPEYPSQVLTTLAMDASQYFANRDFVEAYLQDDSDEAKLKTAAAKRLINRTLNRPSLYYYQKFMRSRLLNDMAGHVYARCWWEREEVETVKRFEDRAVPTDLDIYGDPVTQETEHLRNFEMRKMPVYGFDAVVDQFNFDILDGRNVATPPGYYYSVQQMPWITVRFERTLSQLKADAKRMGYKNLDMLEKVDPPTETETSKAAANDTGEDIMPSVSPEKPYDIYERSGLFWCKVTKRDSMNQPLEVEPAIEENGKYSENAELLETITTFAVSGGERVNIRFQLQPYKNHMGKRYKPILRGLCFIHPTRDNGLGDSTFSAELQVAVNDTYNMGMDREKLSMLPTLVTRKDSAENETVYIAPGHPIEVEDPKADITPLKIDSKLDQTFAGIAFLTNTMQRIKATGPTQYGEVPEKASTTATAVAGAQTNANTRNNFRSITFEYTFLQEFYQMILWMTWQFAAYDTGYKLMGETLKDFDVTAEYLFKPVSQSIETQYSKDVKIKYWISLLQQVVQIPNPKTPVLLNFIFVAVAKLMGEEYANILTALLDPSVPITDKSSPPASGNQTAGAPSNQNGMPISGPEAAARAPMQ